MNLTPVDLLLAAIVLLGALAGWARGFVLSAMGLLTLAAGLAAAFVGYRPVSAWVQELLPALGVWVAPLSFALLFLLVQLVVGSLLHRLALALPRALHGHGINRFLGLLPGLANGALHAVVAALLLLTLPLGERIGGWAQQGVLAPRFAAPAEWVEARLAPVFEPAVQRTLQALVVKPESRTSIPLRFRVAQAAPRPDLEARMLQLVNAEREAAGMQPVQPDAQLTQVARAHSRDMLARGYFSHYSPEGDDLQDRLRRSRVGYLRAGENLALAPTLHSAHAGLMNSPGHRANILRPQFGRLGIGILDAGVHGLMVTQAYRN